MSPIDFLLAVVIIAVLFLLYKFISGKPAEYVIAKPVNSELVKTTIADDGEFTSADNSYVSHLMHQFTPTCNLEAENGEIGEYCVDNHITNDHDREQYNKWMVEADSKEFFQ